MNRVFYIILLLGLVMGSFPSAGMAASQSDPLIVDRIAGQHTDVGDVRIRDDGQYLSDTGQLKVCKAIGIGVTKGDIFTFSVGNTNYDVQAGFCVLAGQ